MVYRILHRRTIISRSRACCALGQAASRCRCLEEGFPPGRTLRAFLGTSPWRYAFLLAVALARFRCARTTWLSPFSFAAFSLFLALSLHWYLHNRHADCPVNPVTLVLARLVPHKPQAFTIDDLPYVSTETLLLLEASNGSARLLRRTASRYTLRTRQSSSRFPCEGLSVGNKRRRFEIHT